MLLRIKIICKIRGLNWIILIIFLSSKIPCMPDHLPNGHKNTITQKLWDILRMKEVLVPINHENLVLVGKTGHKQQFSGAGNSPALPQ